MLGHLGINVPDLAAAKRYYDELMPLVGFELFIAAEDQFAFRPAEGKPGTYCSSIRRSRRGRTRGIARDCNT
jgi:catechol 2,3-dioxygenase-like lactoylglutathione lyase family enzyme